MSAATQSRRLELRVEVWKARSQAKQKWLEGTLSQPAKGPRRAARRLRWVRRTLRAVERRQAMVKARNALLNVYADHLSGVQRILSKAAEEMSGASELGKPGPGSLPQGGGAAGKGPGRPSGGGLPDLRSS
jgi:hypothetical protein